MKLTTGVNFINILCLPSLYKSVLWSFFSNYSLALKFFVERILAQKHIPKARKRHWWLDWIFTPLGSAQVKALSKHVGEIDPSCGKSITDAKNESTKQQKWQGRGSGIIL